ncbi:hypothetical protein Ae331Ps2_6378c [Pseudonocardia sp. Ae331_Ps2]|nr:hypothetical protein Ae331Ps2_6378c [Pseudonocardia sp. Ae331_Ps2]
MSRAVSAVSRAAAALEPWSCTACCAAAVAAALFGAGERFCGWENGSEGPVGVSRGSGAVSRGSWFRARSRRGRCLVKALTR